MLSPPMSNYLNKITKKVQRSYKNVSKSMKKKKVQRRTLAYFSILIITILTLGLFVRHLQAERRARVIQQKHIELKNAKDTLHYVEKQKAETEHELKVKSDTEVQLKQQVEQLNKDLHTKRQTQAQLANARPAEVPRTIEPKVAISQPLKPIAKVAPRGSGGPNLFERGSCTWWVKNWRPEINWSGNANRWAINARAKGWAVGSVPAVNAIGVTTRGAYGHVVLVTKVLGGGRIEIREGNYNYRGSVRTRTTNASEFSAYIY